LARAASEWKSIREMAGWGRGGRRDNEIADYQQFQ
jgi:hypothetical protein